MNTLSRSIAPITLMLALVSPVLAQKDVGEDLKKLTDKDLVFTLYRAAISIGGAAGILSMNTQRYGLNWLADQIKASNGDEKRVTRAIEEVSNMTILLSGDTSEIAGAAQPIAWALQSAIGKPKGSAGFSLKDCSNPITKDFIGINASQVANGILARVENQEDSMIPMYKDSSPNLYKSITEQDSIDLSKGEKPTPTDESFAGALAQLRKSAEYLVLVSAEFDSRMSSHFKSGK